MSGIRTLPEEYFRYHRRAWKLYLLYCTALGVGTLVAVLIPGEQVDVVLGPAGVVAVLMLVNRLVVRGRDARTYDEAWKRIERDEWIALSRSKSTRDALLAVILAQAPLMFFMANVPEEPSVAGMGMMTAAIGSGVYAASLLRRIKPSDDE